MDIQEFCEQSPAQNVRLRCGGEEFVASRFLLACRSQRWRTQLSDTSSNWKSLVVKDLEPGILSNVLDFIHTNACCLVDEYPTVDSLITLMEAADRYGVRSLTKRCCQLLAKKITAENVFKLWEVARHCDQGHALFEACRQYMDELPGSQVAEMVRCYLKSPITRRGLEGVGSPRDVE
eukprot:Protomagalhaensia_sp_Gyna_25__5714@NODE_819_length_2553_cov_50_759745_g646_i0_p3_GENE_NODE_819_length_2553_cov_50_759745_g646_i0NODE_819_length_2553_cov_50_759745_g646_i0_p3_ORF_typecomplete_len178_score25_33BTB/PF00651_31/1_9e14BTB/PF00651_31/5_4e02_NODE_819_length_2553_cov_50_759745_g646_i09621495